MEIMIVLLLLSMVIMAFIGLWRLLALAGRAMSHSGLRRSISCMAAGLLIVGPVAVFFGGDLVDWHPHKIVGVILATLCIAGIVWLFDEIRDIRAEQKLASVNPFMAWNIRAEQKLASINPFRAASPSPQQEPKNETSAEANELLIRRRQSAIFFAGIAGSVMQAQLGTAQRLSTKPISGLGLAEPIAAFGCGLVTKALQLRGIEFSERSLGSDGPLLVLIQFVQTWLPEYSEDYTELARFVARAGSEEKYEKYLKCGQAAFLRFDAAHSEGLPERSDERLTQDTDDLARALGIA
jgi:hypothetical protein